MAAVAVAGGAGGTIAADLLSGLVAVLPRLW